MTKATIVLGASLKPSRYSHKAVLRLQNYNHPVYPVGLQAGEINGVVVDTFDTAFAKAQTHKNNYNTITLYLSPKHQKGYFQYVIDIAPERVIFNPGTENPEFYAVLDTHNIVYEEACTLVLLGTNQY